MFKYTFVILFLYVTGVIPFVIAPVYRYFDKQTGNVSYLEISGTGCFVIANVMLLLRLIKQIAVNRAVKHTFIHCCIKILVKLSFIFGASLFLTAAAYRIVDSKTLYNVYIDMTASLCFTISGIYLLIYYIVKTKQNRHNNKTRKLLIFKYLVKSLYLLGALLFVTSSVYRLYDYVTDSTLFLDIAAIGGFLVANVMLFVQLCFKINKDRVADAHLVPNAV